MRLFKGKGIFNKNKATIINSFNNYSNGDVMCNGHNMSVCGVQGSGITKTLNVDSKPFSRINIEAGVDVNFIISETSSIQIIGDDNLVDLIELVFIDDALDIGFRDCVMFSTRQPMRVNISGPTLDRLNLNGSGDATVSNLRSKHFKLSLTGSGDVTIDGVTENAILKISGSGDIKALDLSTKMLEVNISGSGNVKASATVAAKIRVSGSGNVKVHGNPIEQSVKCSGSGNVKFK